MIIQNYSDEIPRLRDEIGKLKAEREALAEKNEELDAVVNRLAEFVASISDCLTAAKTELAALRADAERLSYMEDADRCYWVSVQSQPHGSHIFSGQGRGLRSAIDAATAQAPAQSHTPASPDHPEAPQPPR